MLGVDGVTILLYAYTIGTLRLHAVGPRSYMIIISKIPRQHIVRILDISESYTFTGSTSCFCSPV